MVYSARSLRLLYLRLFNKEARTVGLMELQFKHRMEQLLSEERICLERHKKELAVGRSLVLYLESVMAEPEFAKRTQWRSSCHLFLSGHPEGNLIKRGQERLSETNLILRENVP